jgi:hypothetical protein
MARNKNQKKSSEIQHAVIKSPSAPIEQNTGSDVVESSVTASDTDLVSLDFSSAELASDTELEVKAPDEPVVSVQQVETVNVEAVVTPEPESRVVIDKLEPSPWDKPYLLALRQEQIVDEDFKEEDARAKLLSLDPPVRKRVRKAAEAIVLSSPVGTYPAEVVRQAKAFNSSR